MNGKICIVTGSNSGIGKVTARVLTEMGATVVMAVRNRRRGESAQKEIADEGGGAPCDLMICDLASRESIRLFANEFKENYDRLDVLINNAGAVFNRREVTPDGFESNLAVNYLGPFLLTHELLPILESSAPSRVINLTSGLHKRAKVDFDDIQSERKYSWRNVYGGAKLLLIMYTYELARRLKDTGVAVNVVSPGFVATNLGGGTGSLMNKIMFKMMRPFQISAEEGAETSLYAATSPEVEGITGKHFSKSQLSPTSDVSYDEVLQKQLWELTVQLLNL
ncbi:MAG: SDR family oxidoreductase [Candidatus Thorarchaeota archaeon]|jgi:NAD(P)-dependent dehydrogenase (short-subunit alcohol dehydrogenase family)